MPIDHVDRLPALTVCAAAAVMATGMVWMSPAASTLDGLDPGRTQGSSDDWLGFSADGEGRVSAHDLSADGIVLGGDALIPVRPGASSPVGVSFTNPNDYPVVVDELSIDVTVRSAPGATSAMPCSAADFSAEQFTGALPLIVPAGSTTTLGDLGVPQAAWPTVSMILHPTDQSGCKSASLDLAFSASGRRSA